ncbi:MAG: hypothetical protein U0989_10100 [Azonexus sp.]|nr:hypothetical protein [Azonexus sp.]MDP3637590.1 hypothetical protein [Azonexus sp.]MDZ4315103.1 hypothetical protein [Azonexus sp.]
MISAFVCLHTGSAIHTFMMNAAAQLGGRSRAALSPAAGALWMHLAEKNGGRN